ncbi:MAG TPA: hypothetical protein VMF31_03615 [Solirubrobacterales bacterium]|nr:hypothetical protein [Solirubrobacterales bacterium]
MRRFLTLLVALLAGLLISEGVVGAASAGDGGLAQTSKSKKAKCKKGKQVKKCRAKLKRERRAKARVTVLSAKATGLATGSLKVRVAAPAKSKVRLTATSTTFDDSTTALTAPKTITIGRKGKVTVSLKLNSASRAAVAGCESRTFTVSAKRLSNKKTSKVIKSMVRDGADCQLSPVDLTRAADCDFIAQPKEGMCMLPWPSDYYTRPDSNSPTGKRIHFTAGGMPVNNEGVPINPDEYSLSDGFSQGAGIALKIPGIDTAAAVVANKFPPINHIGEYRRDDQRVVVIDAETGERWPIWANIDSNARNPEDALVEIKPAENFSAKGRYIVALRNLTDGAGAPLEAPEAFRYYRDDLPSDQDEVNARRDHFEGIFETLKKAGLKRRDLYLAWDFSTASNENNYKRVLSMRDRAFKEELGDSTMGDQIVQGSAPDFTITSTQDFTAGQNARVARRVKGTFEVPCYLEPDCEPGGTMDLDENGLPKRNGYYTANIECIIPRVALDGAPQKMRPLMFGHGLFGRADGVMGSVNPQLAQDHKMVICATDEIGMSGEDPGTVIQALLDLSHFKVLPDRLAQGLLNELFLARLMYHEDGLGTDPAFQNAGQSVIDTDDVFYMGASQGGIMGGALTAVSPDFIQASLLVGAMNYSSLLPRSVDFDLYATFLYPSYPNEMARPLHFGLMQMLWDRSEPNGYAHVMTDNPPPDTPKHNVTLQIALGDHEVTNFAAEVEARTLGMKTNDPPIDSTRWPDMDVLWGVERIKDSEYPFRGSNIIYFDGGPIRQDPGDPSKTIGTTPPPFANIPNRAGQNPHGAPGGATMAVEMTSSFLQRNGYIEDICAPKSCYSDVYFGMP